jgi:hypothetical protein
VSDSASKTLTFAANGELLHLRDFSATYSGCCRLGERGSDRQEFAVNAGYGRNGTLLTSRNGIQTKLLWVGVIALGSVSFGIVALSRGETINAPWLVIAALCIYFIAYRFYTLYLWERRFSALSFWSGATSNV